MLLVGLFLHERIYLLLAGNAILLEFNMSKCCKLYLLS